MSALCLNRVGTTPYFCALPEDHDEDHEPLHARFIISSYVQQLEAVTLTPDESTAVSRAIHYRIPHLQHEARVTTDPDVFAYADKQLNLLMSAMKKLDIP